MAVGCRGPRAVSRRQGRGYHSEPRIRQVPLPSSPSSRGSLAARPLAAARFRAVAVPGSASCRARSTEASLSRTSSSRPARCAGTKEEILSRRRGAARPLLPRGPRPGSSEGSAARVVRRSPRWARPLRGDSSRPVRGLLDASVRLGSRAATRSRRIESPGTAPDEAISTPLPRSLRPFAELFSKDATGSSPRSTARRP